MNDCAMSERSARGYCPGTDGHQEEIDGFADLTTTTTTVAETAQPEVLPHTGADPGLAGIGLAAVLAGVAALQYARRLR